MAKAEANTPSEPMWKVIDKNTKMGEPARFHDCVVDGRIVSYGFEANKGTEMLEAHARKFVPNDSFEVTDDTGRIVTASIPVLKGFSADRESILEDDECVAKFDELTVDALYERAAPLPGGEKIKKNAKKDDLIDFLLTARAAKLAQLRPKALGEDVDGNKDEFSRGELDNIMPPSNLSGLI